MFDRLSTWVSRRAALVVGAWVLAAVAIHLVAPRWDQVTHDGDLAYLPAGMPSVEGERLLHRAFPNERSKSELAIVVERPGSPLTSADLHWSDGLAELFRQSSAELELDDVWNRNTEVVGGKLISRRSQQGQAAVTVLKVRHEFMATANIQLLERVSAMLSEAQRQAPPGLQVGVSGSAAIAGDMLQSAAESIKNTELTTVILVVLILLLVYRAPLLVLVPLITIGASLFVATDVLALATQVNQVPGFDWWTFKVFTTTRIFIVVILFGSGTDFCLFLIARYREELEQGIAARPAVGAAVRQVGGALVASAMTTICGLAMMYFAAFGKFQNSGPAIAIALVVTLLACLTLAPALLAMMGKAVFWPFGLRAPQLLPQAASDLEHGTQSRFWRFVAGAVVARPGLILVASVALLAPLAVFGWSVPVTYNLLSELEPNRLSVLGSEMARRHFAAGEMTPITVLAYQQDGQFNVRAGERAIERLTKTLYDLPYVDSVRSIAAPTGDRPGYTQPFRASGLQKLAARKHKITKARFLTQQPELVGQVARFDLVFPADPFSPEAVKLVDKLEAFLDEQSADAKSDWQGAQFAFVGTSVGVRDLAQVTYADQRLIERLVVLAVLAVLLVLLRRPLVCIYLIVSVLFSYLVTIGATEIFFRWAYGATFEGLDWKVPLFLFVILIAVGEDYNIYLVTRVLEEQEQRGGMAGLRYAVERTGGIITSCGVIMAGTFISMTTGTLRGITELGFALSLGILLDTCVVRPVLVPAFLALIERYGPRRGRPDLAPPNWVAEPAETPAIPHG